MTRKPLVSKKNIIALASTSDQLRNATTKPAQPAAMDRGERTLFDELCGACRVGDREKVESLVSNFAAPINLVDEWQCSPLYWACLCGHYEVVRYLLENGAKCDRNTFQGERCLYGALTKQIRDLLLSYKLSKAIDKRQPYLYFLSQLQDHPKDYFPDITFKVRVPLDLDDLHHPSSSGSLVLYRDFPAHRSVLATRSSYFARQLATRWRGESEVRMGKMLVHPACFEAVLRYLYVGHPTELEPALANEMMFVCDQLALPELREKYIKEKEDQEGKKSAVREAEAEDVVRIQADFGRFLREMVFRAVGRIVDGDGEELKGIQEVPESDEEDYDYDYNDNPQSLTVVLDDLADNSNSGTPFDPTQTHADIAIRIDDTIFLCHKAFLLRSEYFTVMFNGAFTESAMAPATIIYKANPSSLSALGTLTLPLITLHALAPATFRVCLEFLYTDRCGIEPEVAYDVLMTADMLLLDRLKAIASITITNTPNPDKRDVYRLARVAVDLRVDRLEQWCAKWFADHLDEVLEEAEFAELVRESAEGIKARQETGELCDWGLDMGFHLQCNAAWVEGERRKGPEDICTCFLNDTIPVIDDLRYWLSKKYGIDEDLDGKGRVNYELMEHWTDLETEYNAALEKLDRVLERLGLEA
ncbi:hypothetical protein BC936DRAFT_143285 [Jimgerdemannia flammicorona]|uniref:Uncharacterized protein n=2 Tax=Jimgerdemannia flammicorona TaxID=994334 RepID=A0A433QLF2_9FUNG|nr:hypothetical protein BC936DRAFT_143285 [Jimgerdemannia flammicorona]RUS30623.1 hypothetical protein BC938DRAFT_479145 [Jimgerdemannia flammicorona]